MRITYVVQRYGPEIAGGAEAACRSFATELARRGHEVEVITSCAVDYRTWKNEFPEGRSVIDGVAVTRLPAELERDASLFGALSGRLQAPRCAPVVEAAWMQAQGPWLARLEDQLTESARRSDVMIFMTYLYPPTVIGLPGISGAVPTLVHPTAHEEWPFRRRITSHSLRHADGIACFSPEERRLVERRIRPRCPVRVVPLGLADLPSDRNPKRFRQRFDLSDAPYVLCLGRVDPNKGIDELVATFQAFRTTIDPSLHLVLMGAQMMDLPRIDGLRVTGFVDDATKWDALAGAIALVQPSRQESYSIALVEAWQSDTPVIVNRECDVLSGFVERSEGGLAYDSPSELAESVRVLVERPRARDSLGAAGGHHVRMNLGWDTVVETYAGLIEDAANHRRASCNDHGGC